MEYYLWQKHSGRSETVSINLVGDEIIVGRHTHPELSKYFLSERHAIFLTRSSEWWIKDTGCSLGLYVNGQRIGTSMMKLKVGDTIGFGSPDLDMENKHFVCFFLRNVEVIDSFAENDLEGLTSISQTAYEFEVGEYYNARSHSNLSLTDSENDFDQYFDDDSVVFHHPYTFIPWHGDEFSEDSNDTGTNESQKRSNHFLESCESPVGNDGFNFGNENPDGTNENRRKYHIVEESSDVPTNLGDIGLTSFKLIDEGFENAHHKGCVTSGDESDVIQYKEDGKLPIVVLKNIEFHSRPYLKDSDLTSQSDAVEFPENTSYPYIKICVPNKSVDPPLLSGECSDNVTVRNQPIRLKRTKLQFEGNKENEFKSFKKCSAAKRKRNGRRGYTKRQKRSHE